MASPRTDEALAQAVRAVEEALRKGYKPTNFSVKAGEYSAVRVASKHLGIARTTFQYIIKEAEQKGIGPDWSLYKLAGSDDNAIPENDTSKRLAALRGELGFAPVLPGYEAAQISTNTRTGEAWVKQKPERGPEFEIPDGHIVKGISALVGADGRTVASWVKTKEGISLEATLDTVREAFADFEHKSPSVAPPAGVAKDLLTVYPLADVHLGMFAWGREAGADYDLKIAEKLLLESVRKLVESSPPSSTGIILNLGDFVHADDSRNQTARSGNPLDVDTRYQKVVQVAVRALIACVISALAKHDRVILRNVPGNHDTHTAIALTVALAAYFHNEPRVTVDDSPSRFFFHKFGHVMIAAAHGDMIKPTEMAGMCAARQPEMWGSTKYRHGLMGHIHHASAKEMNGMLVETFRTIAARDAWHAAGPHTAQRSICHIVFDRNKGEDSRKSINI